MHRGGYVSEMNSRLYTVTNLWRILLVLIAFTVVMLIQVVGIILVIALLTLPAAISRECTGDVKTMMICAVLLGTAFTTTGIFLSAALDVPSGATIILISAGVYAGVLVLKRVLGNPPWTRSFQGS